MTIQEYYEISWFANLSYVNWEPDAVSPDENTISAYRQAILDANL